MNPIHEENGKWYFWDETWAHRMGPYDSREKVEKEFKSYIDIIEWEIKGE